MKSPSHENWRLDLNFQTEKDKDNYSHTCASTGRHAGFTVHPYLCLGKTSGGLEWKAELNTEGFTYIYRQYTTRPELLETILPYIRCCQKVLGQWHIFCCAGFCTLAHWIRNETMTMALKHWLSALIWGCLHQDQIELWYNKIIVAYCALLNSSLPSLLLNFWCMLPVHLILTAGNNLGSLGSKISTIQYVSHSPGM